MDARCLDPVYCPTGISTRGCDEWRSSSPANLGLTAVTAPGSAKAGMTIPLRKAGLVRAARRTSGRTSIQTPQRCTVISTSCAKSDTLASICRPSLRGR